MRVKLLKYSLCFMLAAIMLPSCNFLQNAPEGELTLEEIFNDRALTRRWFVGVYAGIPDPYMPMVQNYDAYADDFSPSTGWNQFGWDCIDKIKGQWDANSDWGGGFWGNLPTRIRAGYIFLENVKPNEQQEFYQDEVDEMKAEVRFLIAYYFYLMANTYGAIPFQNYLADRDATYEELLLGQTPYHEVIDWVDNELQEVAKLLPARRANANEFGRATSVMALAVRARMLLFAASPLVNGNTDPDYVNYTNDKGEKLFDLEYKTERWEKARKANKELIDLALANKYELYKEYNDDGTIDPFMSYMNMTLAEYPKNTEILFGRQSSDYSWLEGTAAPITVGGQNGMGVTQSLVDAFFMKDGRSPILGHERTGNTVKPIFNTDPLVTMYYSEKGFSNSADTRKTKWNYGSATSGSDGRNVVAPAGTFNMYVNREPRFYISVMFHNQYHKAAGENMQFGKGQNNGRQERWWDSPQNGYLLRKRIHPESHIRDNIRPYRPGILYRLAEAYLSYAEAAYHVDPSDPLIIEYLNAVRERAGIATYGSDPSTQIPVPTGEDLLTAIKRERRVEFNCEYAIRFDDIRRWMEMDLLSGPFDGMNANGSITTGEAAYDETNPDAFFVRTTYITRAFSDKNYWFPIHQNQIDKNPNLRQLPKW